VFFEIHFIYTIFYRSTLYNYIGRLYRLKQEIPVGEQYIFYYIGFNFPRLFQ